MRLKVKGSRHKVKDKSNFLLLAFSLYPCSLYLLLAFILVPLSFNLYPYSTGSLEGTIRDSISGEPVMGAVITLQPGDLASFTFGDGHYRFIGLAQGTYQVTVEAEGYASISQEVQVQSGQTTMLEIALSPLGATATLHGTVVDHRTGRGVQGAQIRLEPGSIVSYTDDSGGYTVSSLAPGTYTLTVSHEDYFSITRAQVVVAAGAVREENFTLYRDQGRIAGRVENASTHKGIPGATVRSEDGQFSTTASAKGIFLLNNVPAGVYTLIFEAPNYRSVTRRNVRVESTRVVVVNVEMEPTRPVVSEARANPAEILIPRTSDPTVDPAAFTLLTARVYDPDGPGDIVRVSADLTPLAGSSTQPMYDDGTHGDVSAGDGVYSLQAAASSDTAVGEIAITVTATDTHGAQGKADISIHAYHRRQQTLQPRQTDVHTFRNRISGQTLTISYQLLGTSQRTAQPAGPLRQEECITSIQIEGPDGTVLGPIPLTTTGAETQIPTAAEGQWIYRVITQCPEPRSYTSSARGSGTGLIVGMVRDSQYNTGIDGALIQTDGGAASIATEGRFLMVAPAGATNLRATALSYADTTAQGVTLLAGETREVEMDMLRLLTLSANQSTHIAGSTLGFTLQYFNPGASRQVDTYFLMLAPDRQTLAAWDEQLIPRIHTLGDGSALEAVGRNLPFTTTSLRADNFYTFTGIEPTGEYAVYIVLTLPGSPVENMEGWVAWAECRFVFQ